MESNVSSMLERGADAAAGSDGVAGADVLDGLDEAGLQGLIGEAAGRLGEARLAEVAGLVVDRLGDAGLLAAAEGAVRRLAEAPLSGAVEDAVLASSVARLGWLERRVAAEKLRRLGEVDRRRAYRAAGHASSEELLAAGKALTRGEAKAQADAARALEQLPLTARKLADGQLGMGHAQAAARALRQLPGELDPDDRAEVVEELDELVADAAGRSDRRRLAETLDAWGHAIDERLIADREQRAWQRREASQFKDRDGSTIWRLRLDPVGAAKVNAMVQPLARRDGAGDDRSRGQRLADAFVAAAERLLDGGDLPEVAAQRPHVVCITNRDALDGVAGADPSSLDGVGIVSSAVARMIACDGQVTEVVVDERGHPLVVKEPSKPTRRQRAAVIARDRACVGCGAAVVRCELHHIRWRRHQGATVVNNLVLVCWGCHHQVHHHGWQIAKRDGRYGLAEPRPASGQGCEADPQLGLGADPGSPANPGRRTGPGSAAGPGPRSRPPPPAARHRRTR